MTVTAADGWVFKTTEYVSVVVPCSLTSVDPPGLGNRHPDGIVIRHLSDDCSEY